MQWLGMPEPLSGSQPPTRLQQLGAQEHSGWATCASSPPSPGAVGGELVWGSVRMDGAGHGVLAQMMMMMSFQSMGSSSGLGATTQFGYRPCWAGVEPLVDLS